MAKTQNDTYTGPPLPEDDIPLLEAFNQACRDNPNITAADATTVAAGRAIAQQIDDVISEYQMDQVTRTDLTKALYLMPHLIGIQKELLGTPLSRTAAGMVKKETQRSAKLDGMRQDQSKKAEGQ